MGLDPDPLTDPFVKERSLALFGSFKGGLSAKISWVFAFVFSMDNRPENLGYILTVFIRQWNKLVQRDSIPPQIVHVSMGTHHCKKWIQSRIQVSSVKIYGACLLHKLGHRSTNQMLYGDSSTTYFKHCLCGYRNRTVTFVTSIKQDNWKSTCMGAIWYDTITQINDKTHDLIL